MRRCLLNQGILSGCMLGMLLGVATGAQAAPQSVSDFLKLKPKWDQLVGLEFLLEGRFGGSTSEFLSLRHLPLAFRSSRGIDQRYESRDVLQVLGKLQRDSNGMLYFELLDVRKGLSDLDRLRARAQELPLKDPEPVYELGDWARRRGEFYGDAELKAEAVRLYTRGIRREQAQLETRDYPAYRRLAVKAVRYGLGDRLKVALLYEGHYRQWQLDRNKFNSLQLAGLATAVAAELPGAAVPAPIDDEAFHRKWKAEPLRVYEEATFGFEQMHRFLYQEIMLDSILKDAAPDGRNGSEIATRLRSELPEFAAMADDWVRQEQDWLMRNLESLSMDQLLALREALLEAGEADRADEALKTWFRHRETRLRTEGIDGLIELSSLYETLFPDGARDAVRILLEADRRKPGSSIVRQRLESHGFQQINGDWKSSDEVHDFENSPINRAMREGRVIPGMTEDQVRRALGEPSSISRVLTARHVIDYWIYSDPRRSRRLTIRLSRPTQRRSSIVASSREIGM